MTRNPLSWDYGGTCGLFHDLSQHLGGPPCPPPPALPPHGHTPPSQHPRQLVQKSDPSLIFNPNLPPLAPPDSQRPNAHLHVHGRVIPHLWIVPVAPRTQTQTHCPPYSLSASCLVSPFSQDISQGQAALAAQPARQLRKLGLSLGSPQPRAESAGIAQELNKHLLGPQLGESGSLSATGCTTIKPAHTQP